MKEFLSRHRPAGLLALVLVAGLSWVGLQKMNAQPTPAGQQVRVVAVERRPISASISASGAIEPKADVALTFGTMGRLVKLYVNEGDRVTGDQLLAALDTTELEFQVSQAEAALVAAKAQLTQLEELPLAQDVASAKAVLAAAKANRDDLVNRKVSQYQIDAAQAQMDQAQAALDKVLGGPTPGQLTAAQAQAAQVYAQLEQARARLNLAQLRAPFAGTITDVQAEVGAQVNQQSPVMSLADLSEFHVTVNVDQADIGRVSEGQLATVTVDAYRDRPLEGRVAFIAPAATNQTGGVVSYRVRINIKPTTVAVRAGLTGNVAIVTASRDAALVVPSRSIELDRETGKAYVLKDVDGKLERVEIQTGIRGETYSEILHGLAEGDRVAVNASGASGNIADLFYMPGQVDKSR